MDGDEPSPAPRRVRKALAAVADLVPREAWRLTKLLSATFLSAVLPVRFAELHSILPAFLKHLRRYADGKPRQLETFRRALSDAVAGDAGTG